MCSRAPRKFSLTLFFFFPTVAPQARGVPKYLGGLAGYLAPWSAAAGAARYEPLPAGQDGGSSNSWTRVHVARAGVLSLLLELLEGGGGRGELETSTHFFQAEDRPDHADPRDLRERETCT